MICEDSCCHFMNISRHYYWNYCPTTLSFTLLDTWYSQLVGHWHSSVYFTYKWNSQILPDICCKYEYDEFSQNNCTEKSARYNTYTYEKYCTRPWKNKNKLSLLVLCMSQMKNWPLGLVSNNRYNMFFVSVRPTRVSTK